MRGEGVAQHEHSVPSLEDLPIIEANPPHPMDPMVTKEPGDLSPLSILDVIPSNPLLDSIKPE